MEKANGNPVAALADQFGGLTAFARALGHRHPTTVQGWINASRIPYWRKAEVQAACMVHKKRLNNKVFGAA